MASIYISGRKTLFILRTPFAVYCTNHHRQYCLSGAAGKLPGAFFHVDALLHSNWCLMWHRHSAHLQQHAAWAFKTRHWPLLALINGALPLSFEIEGCKGITQIILICKVLWTELGARRKWLDLNISAVEQMYAAAEAARQSCWVSTHTVQHSLSFSQHLPGRRVLDQDTYQNQLLLTWIVSWPCP